MLIMVTAQIQIQANKTFNFLPQMQGSSNELLANLCLQVKEEVQTHFRKPIASKTSQISSSL